MFTGIISHKGTIGGVVNGRLSVHSPSLSPKNGDSVSVNGVCLTLVDVLDGTFGFDVVPETFDRSNLGDLESGAIVNIEQAMLASDRIDGHIVTGHVDCVGLVKSLDDVGNSKILTVEIPIDYAKYVAVKGSITLNGVSLTVVNVSGMKFSVALVPYTCHETNLGSLKIDDKVNVEVDIMARYLERLNQFQNEDRDSRQ